jgi:hypothetical protein
MSYRHARRNTLPVNNAADTAVRRPEKSRALPRNRTGKRIEEPSPGSHGSPQGPPRWNRTRHLLTLAA